MTTTSIEWSTDVWNPVTGCTKVSEGCRHCYASRWAGRQMGEWKGRRFEDVRLHADRLDMPLRARKPRRYFVNSMSDLFHEDVPDDFIQLVFAVMAASPRQRFIVLTKRPVRVRNWFGKVSAEAHGWADRADGSSIVDMVWHRAHVNRVALPNSTYEPCKVNWPLPNVALGVSVEDQRTADERVPLLLDTPAACRVVSYEPALGAVDFRVVPIPVRGPREIALRRLDWIIVGGESGPGSRPFDVAWARSTVSQCRDSGSACFVKQLGARPYMDGGFPRLRYQSRKGNDPAEWPADLRVREIPEAMRLPGETGT